MGTEADVDIRTDRCYCQGTLTSNGTDVTVIGTEADVDIR